MDIELDIELSIQLVPTDKGLMLLANANDNYKTMVQQLRTQHDGEFEFCLPRQGKDNHLIDEMRADLSVMSMEEDSRLYKGGVVLLYEQPYSEPELDSWCIKATNQFKQMKQEFRRLRRDIEREEIGVRMGGIDII
jgi:hypothetical protein